ncbi:MAG: Tat pathway signal protein [Verrucomicrobiae bacterium]|nr:Tat pathway signal protein [Verrucomicrobiae bacterium]
MHGSRWLLTGLSSLVVLTGIVHAETDDAFLERLQKAAFGYFWHEVNPENGLVRDRSAPGAPCSIAAVGFGLSAIVIGIEREWVDRSTGRQRVLRTLETLARGPQGPDQDGMMGHRGWYYHFLEMDSGLRAWQCELSSMDTALLLAGVLDASLFFEESHPGEARIRTLSRQLVDRVDWQWMANGEATLTMGWRPEAGFLESRWRGYNEAMILYLLALGASAESGISWEAWTSGYRWETHYGQSYVVFAPLFGHQYSHCWVDFRGIADAYMRRRGITYFENSRRATLAQRAYCIGQSARFPNYGPLEWGLTACDGPDGYAARGAPPPENDDGTLAPTAVGGSLPFAPEVCLPTLRALETNHRDRLWGPYGFRDAFNRTRDWWATDTLGIDQGAILLMAENYRTGSVWRRMKRGGVLERGLKRAGFAEATGP